MRAYISIRRLVAQLEEVPTVPCIRNQVPGSDLPPRPTKSFINLGLVNWYQTCLERMKRWLVHLLATAIHCMAKCALKLPPRHPIEVVVHLEGDWITLSLVFSPMDSDWFLFFHWRHPQRSCGVQRQSVVRFIHSILDFSLLSSYCWLSVLYLQGFLDQLAPLDLCAESSLFQSTMHVQMTL